MTTAAEALAAYYAANGIEADPARAATWICKIGPVLVEFPNWKWRRDAITRHDLHHILTGYPCTMTGEMQMAAWEFAADATATGRRRCSACLWRFWASSLHHGRPRGRSGRDWSRQASMAANWTATRRWRRCEQKSRRAHNGLFAGSMASARPSGDAPTPDTRGSPSPRDIPRTRRRRTRARCRTACSRRRAGCGRTARR